VSDAARGSPLTLSAALIVRDEARHLGDCLASIAPLVDEVVVVDTGSVDDTMEIARRAGARVFQFPWNGRFDDARNAALDRCSGRWILYIDADERVQPALTESRLALSTPRLLACRVPFYPRVGFTPYLEMRLFRNLPGIRFRGRIHETIIPSVEECIVTHGGYVGVANIPIHHLGYEGDLGHKHRRNLPLLREAVRDDPGRLFLWCDLARAAAALGEHEEAEAAWRRATRIVEESGACGGLASLPFIDLIAYRAHRGEPTGSDLDRALHLFPDNVPLRWLLGRERLREGRAAEALAVFEDLVHLGEAGAIDPNLAFDSRIVGVYPMEALADCYFRLGRFADAVPWFARALAHNPENLELRTKAAIASARARETR
jgi:hypothetical protein